MLTGMNGGDTATVTGRVWRDGNMVMENCAAELIPDLLDEPGCLVLTAYATRLQANDDLLEHGVQRRTYQVRTDHRPAVIDPCCRWPNLREQSYPLGANLLHRSSSPSTTQPKASPVGHLQGFDHRRGDRTGR